VAINRKFWSTTKVAALLAIVAASGIIIAFSTWSFLDSQKLRVGFIESDLNQLSCYFAQDQGLYRAAGLDMKYLQFTDDQAVMDALASGQIDIAFTSLTSAIMYNRNNNTPITILAAASVDGTGIVVRTNSSITSIANLTGKTVAIPVVNGAQDFLLQVMLENASLTRSNVSIVEEDVNSMADDMNSSTTTLGHIDAYVAWEPIAAKGVHKDIYGLYGYFGRYLNRSIDIWPNHPGDVIVVRNAVLAQAGYVDAIKHFLAVHVSVTNQINTMAANASVNATVYSVIATQLSTNPADGTMGLANTGFVYQPDLARVRDFIAEMVHFKLIASIPNLNSYLASVYNTTLLNQTII